MRAHFDRQVLADLLAEDTGCEPREIDIARAVGVEAVEEGPHIFAAATGGGSSSSRGPACE